MHSERLRLSETSKHIKNFLGCYFGDLKRKTDRSTSKSSKDGTLIKSQKYQIPASDSMGIW